MLKTFSLENNGMRNQPHSASSVPEVPAASLTKFLKLYFDDRI